MQDRYRVAALVISLSLSVGFLLPLVPGGTAAAAPTGAVRFTAAEIVEQQGDVATIPIQFTNTDRATLNIKSSDGDYRVTALVTDGNGDGTVHVRLNTFRGIDRPGSPAYATSDPDDYVVVLFQSTTQSLPTLEAERYHLIVETDSSRVATVLRLEPPTVNGSRTGVVATLDAANVPRITQTVPTADASTTNKDDASTADGDDAAVVARGDIAVVEFNVSGVEGALQSDAPAEGLVFANDSTPGAVTTHLVRLSPTRPLYRSRSITIDYYQGSPPDILPLSRDGLRTLGVDSDDDGRVDRSLKGAVTGFKVDSSGGITINFDRTLSLDTTDTLLVEYPTVNPSGTSTRANPVEVEFAADHYTETGRVHYGSAGDGTLGNGVDLRFRSQDDGQRLVVPLTATNTTFDAEANTLSARIDTVKLPLGTYEVSLVLSDPVPVVDGDGGDGAGDGDSEEEAVVMRERVAVVEPSVTIARPRVIDQPDGTGSDAVGQHSEQTHVEVSARTNLAPGNRLLIEGYAKTEDSWAWSQCVTFVTANGTVSCTFDLPARLADEPLEVSVVHEGETLAGSGVPFGIRPPD